MVGTELQMINPIFLLRYLKGHCHGNKFCGKIWKNYLPPAVIAVSFRNGIGYRYINERMNRFNDAFILCEKFVKFGPIVFELKWDRK